MQILVNILISASIYLIIALAVQIIYRSAKFFDLSIAALITLGPYFVYLLNNQFRIIIFFSIPFAIVIILLIDVLIAKVVFESLRKKVSHSFIMLVASLGIYIILQNTISLIWGDNTKSVRSRDVKVGHEIFGAYITNIQIQTIVVSLILFTVILIFLNYTRIGLKIRAISSNEELANIFGINSNKVILLSFAIGSALVAIAGILVAFDTDMTPTMGFNLLLYGVVVMIIGGVGSTWGLLGGAFLLATAQHLGTYYIDAKWMDAIAYLILILFLIWKPLGFSGKQLKKIEI